MSAPTVRYATSRDARIAYQVVGDGPRNVALVAGPVSAIELLWARWVELAGSDNLTWGEGAEVLVDHIEEFLTGSRRLVPTDRVLATVLFTDIVDSTRLAAQLGDRRWRELLDRHDDLV